MGVDLHIYAKYEVNSINHVTMSIVDVQWR